MRRLWTMAGVCTLVAASACSGAGTTAGGAPDDSGSSGGSGAGSDGSGAGSGGSSAGSGGSSAGTGGSSAGTGGSSAGSGGSGAGTGGSSGSGGGSDAGGAVCIDPDGLNPNVATTTSGSNGTFADQCDVSGNLIEFTCETIFVPNCGPSQPTCIYGTGLVIENHIDCAGRCQNGACSGRCPQQGDTLTYLEVNAGGSVVLRNQADGSRYSCAVSFDATTDTYDCYTDPVVGTTTKVYSLGLASQICVSTELGNIGTSQTSAQQCTYACTMIL